MRHVPTYRYPIGYGNLLMLAGCLCVLLLAIPAEAQRGKGSELRKQTVTRGQANSASSRSSSAAGSKFIVNTKARIQGPQVPARASTPIQGPVANERRSASPAPSVRASTSSALRPSTSARIAPSARPSSSASTRHQVAPTRSSSSVALRPNTNARLPVTQTVTRTSTTTLRVNTDARLSPAKQVTQSDRGHGSHDRHSSHGGHGHSSHHGHSHSSHKSHSKSGLSIVIGGGSYHHRPHVAHGAHVHTRCAIYTHGGSRYCRVHGHGHGHRDCSLYREYGHRTHVYRPHVVHTPVRTACVVVHYPGTTIRYCKSHHFSGGHSYCPVPHADGWHELSVGHFAVAESVFKHHLIHDPYNARMRVGYSLSVAMNGDHPRAVSEMRKALANHSGVLRTIHLSPTTMNYVTKEISHYKNALTHTKFKADVSFMVAALEVLHGHYSEAKRYLDYARHYGDHSTARYQLESEVNRELYSGQPAPVHQPGYLGDY